MNAECRFVGSLLHQALEYKHLAAKSMERGNAPGALIHTLVTAVLLKNARDQWQRACEENDGGGVCDLDWKLLDEEYVDVVSRLPSLKVALRRSLATTPAPTPRVSSSDSKDDDGNVACTMVKELREVDCIYFRDLAGMAAAKSDLLTYFVNPLIYPNLYARNGARSILLYGLPGTGKTFLAKAAVNELQRADPNVGVVFYAPTGAELKGKYVGETEKRVAAYFDCAARRAAECGADGTRTYIAVLFIDEIEAVAGDRTADQSGVMTNSVNVLLQKMDGISSHKNVVVLAATNFPDKLDSAVRRRFAREIHVGLPKPGEIQAALQRELARYAELALDAPSEPKAGGAAAGACGATVIQPACTAGFHNEPFDSLGFAVSSDDLKDVSETMYVRNFSNSDASRLAAYVINQAGNRALAGTFRPYRAKKYHKGQKELVYLSDFAAPKESDTVWVAEQKNSDEAIVGPFVSNGTVKYGGSTYASSDAAVKNYGVDGIQAVYQQAARAGLLVVGARTIGPYTVWVDVPAPPTLDAKTGVRGVAATLFGSTRVAQVFAKAARVLLIRSDTEAMEITEPPAWLLSRLAQAMLVDAVEDQDDDDDDDEDDDGDRSENDPLDMTTMFFRDVPHQPADVYTYLARALWTRRSALERLKVATAPPSSIPSASGGTLDDSSSSANDVRRRLKTLFITKQDFVDGMATVRSTIRPAEKKHMDQIAATGHGN